MTPDTKQFIITLLQSGQSCREVAEKVMSALPLFTGYYVLLVPASPGAVVGTQLSLQPITSDSLLEKLPLEQLILPLSSRSFWT